MSPTTNVLVTGTNRGIGKGLVETLLTRPNHVVIATVRDLSKAQSLLEFPAASGSRLVVLKLDAAVETDAAQAIGDLLKQNPDIDHLDVVIANAGYVIKWPYIAELKIADMLDCFGPNVFGIVWLYQATRELMNKSANPKWVTIGSTAGSIAGQLDGPSGTYGPSKAAAHWITKRINGEEEKYTSFVIHPGWVRTDMGNLAASLLGMEQAPCTIRDSVDGILALVDKATKETHGGGFWEYNGQPYLW